MAKKPPVRKPPPKTDTISDRQMAAEFGWPLAVLKSSPDLYHVFRQAVAGTWSGDRFLSAVENTQWFKTHSDAMRTALLQKASDPATYRRNLNQARASVRDAAVQLGAQLDDKAVTRIAQNVLTFGWNDAQIRDTLAGAVKPGAVGTYGGQAATNVQDLQQVAFNNGVKLSDGTVRQWAVRMAAGEDPSGFEQYVRNMALQAFPGLADQIKGGMDVRDVAEPYIQQMASTWQVDPAAIDLFDPTLRKAMQATDAQGKVATKPLWQFENELRHDNRYDKTDQARQDASQLNQAFLSSFGAI